jgi:hypothetical protein
VRFDLFRIILSVTWVIHIAIFVLPQRPYYTFLNRFFIILEEAFGKGKNIRDVASHLPLVVIVRSICLAGRSGICNLQLLPAGLRNQGQLQAGHSIPLLEGALILPLSL